jgi:hypothetical protein
MDGKRIVKLEWQAAVAQTDRESRKMEQLRQSRVDEAARMASGRDRDIRADAARSRLMLVGLRDDLDAVKRASAQSLDAATKSVAALSDVFQQCSRAYSELAEVADRHASDSLMYQQGWPK